MWNFDILEWWKTQKVQYFILSLMNCNMLTPSISSLELKSTFSLDNWILNDKHLSVSYENLEMVIYWKDWYDAEDR